MSTSSSAWRPPRPCASMSRTWRPARRLASKRRRRRARSAGSRSSSTGPPVGAASSASSPGSRSATKAPIPASLSPTSPVERPRRSTRMSTAGAARPRTTSSPGRRIWPPTARPAQGDSQPVPAVPACRRLLADVGLARRDAEALEFCRRAIRHAAIAPHQDRRAGGRDENPNSPAPADLLPGPVHPTHRPQSHTAARDINDGAQTPRNEPADRNLQTPPSITTDYRRRPTGLVEKHRNGDQIAASTRRKLIAVHQAG